MTEVDLLRAEIARLTPQPNTFNALTSAIYRDGPLTPEIYDEAIADLQAAKLALVNNDHMGCDVCGDSDHGANSNCRHNPLLVARLWARASMFYQCWHCGYIATNAEEGNAHFGLNETETPACLKQPAVSDALLASWDRVSGAINRMVLAQPSRMTEAAERLREAQAEHQQLLNLEGRRAR